MAYLGPSLIRVAPVAATRVLCCHLLNNLAMLSTVERRATTAAAVEPQSDFAIATEEHCVYCFHVLCAHLGQQHAPSATFKDGDCPLFVTWNKMTWQGGHQLRGCIGTLEPRQLHTAVKDYALTSALRDSRFSPIHLKELTSLSCTVSLLRAFEQTTDYKDWVIGQHGLIINFVDPVLQCRRSATFLPEVAYEQGWTHQQCIDALIKKAGYAGHISNDLRRSLKVTRYQSSKASLSYQEYCAVSGRLRPAAASHAVEESGVICN